MKNMASLVRKGIQSRISGNGLFSNRNNFQHQLPLMPLSISFSISITIRHNSYTPSPPLFSPLRILDSKRYLDETARKISCGMDKERVKRILDAIGNREVDMNADYGNGIQEFKGKDNGFVLSIKRACVGIHLHRDDETFGIFQIRSEFLDDSNEGELEALCLCYILAVRVLGLKLRCVSVNNKSNLSFVNSWNWQDRLLFKSQAYKVLLPIIIELKGSSSIQHVPRILNIIADASATHGIELLNRKDDKTAYLYKSGDVEKPEVYIYVRSPDDLLPSHYLAFLAYRNIMNGDVEQYLKDMAEKKKTLRKEEKKRQKEENKRQREEEMKRQKEEKKRQREEEKKRLREEKKRHGEEEEKNRLKEEKEEEKNRLKEEAKKSQEEVETKIRKEEKEGKGQEEEEEEEK